MVNVPGFNLHAAVPGSKKEKADSSSVAVTVVFSPGLRRIFRNPFSSLGGRGTEGWSSET